MFNFPFKQKKIKIVQLINPNNSCIHVLFIFFYVILCLRYYIEFEIFIYTKNLFLTFPYRICVIFYVVLYFLYRIIMSI